MQKGVEIAPFEIRVVELFPKSQEFNRFAGTHPVLDNIFRFAGIFAPGNVGERNVVFAIYRFYANGDPFYL